MNKITSILPLMSVGILIFSILDTFFYYWFFDFPILDFISLQEIPLLITENIVYTILFILSGLPVYFSYSTSDSRKNQSSSKSKKNISTPPSSIGIDFYSMVCRKGLTKKTFIFLIVMVLYGAIAFFCFPSDIFLKSLSCLEVITLLVCYLFLKFSKFIIRNFKGKYLFFFGFSFMLLTSYIVIAILKGDNVYKGKFRGTYVETLQHKYEANDTLVYIGKTSTYFFFYNKNNKSTTVVPNSEVKKILIKKSL